MTQEDVERIKRKELETYRKVFEFLRDNPGNFYSPREISEATGENVNDVENALLKMEIDYLLCDEIHVEKVEIRKEKFYGVKERKSII